MSEESGVTNGDTEGAMPGLEVPNWCEGCPGCQALRKELQDKEAEHKRVWLAIKQKIISTDLLLKQNAEFKARYNAKAQECDIQRQKIEEATRQLASTERLCETLQMQLDSALKEMEPLKKRKMELEENQKMCKAEVEEAKDRTRASEGLCKQYREMIKKFEDEEAEREANSSTEKKDHVSAAKLKDDVTKLKAELSLEKRKNRGLERELDRAKVAIEGLQEQNSRVQQQDGTPSYIPAGPTTRQPRRSHITRTPKQYAPPPAGAMNCSTATNPNSDEEETDWSKVVKRGVLSPVHLQSPLSPLPPTPAPCQRVEEFSSTSDSSEDNSDMEDDADRIENELLCDMEALPLSDANLTDDEINNPPKHSPIRNNNCHELSSVKTPKQPPTVNVTDEKGNTKVKWSSRENIKSLSPPKLTPVRRRVQNVSSKRGRGRPPLRRVSVAKAIPAKEKVSTPIEPTKVGENDYHQWFGEVEDLSDSESECSPEKDKKTEAKVKGAESSAKNFASPPRMTRMCSTASAKSNSDDDASDRQSRTRRQGRLQVSPKRINTAGITPSRYPLRSRSQESVKPEQKDNITATTRKKAKSESEASEEQKEKVMTSPRTRYELRSRQENKTDYIAESPTKPPEREDNKNIVSKDNNTSQQQKAINDTSAEVKKEQSKDDQNLNSNTGDKEKEQVEDVKLKSKEETKASLALEKSCSSNELESHIMDSKTKISSPYLKGHNASLGSIKPCTIMTKTQSDHEDEEKSRSESPEFRRPQTRSLAHGTKVIPGGRRDSSSSEMEDDVSPKRVTRQQTKLIRPLAGPSSRTRSRSTSSEKGLSDGEVKGTPKGAKARRNSGKASLSSEKRTTADAVHNVPKGASPKKSVKDLSTADISPSRSSENHEPKKEADTALARHRAAVNLEPQMVVERHLLKVEPHRNSRNQTKTLQTDVSEKEAISKNPEVCSKEGTLSSNSHTADKEKPVAVEKPVDEPLQQRESSQRIVSGQEQSVEEGAKCVEDAASVKVNLIAEEQVADANEIHTQAVDKSNIEAGSNLETPQEVELEHREDEDTLEDGELSESETEDTNGAQDNEENVQEHQGAVGSVFGDQRALRVPERAPPSVSRRSSRSSLSTSPVSPLPPSPFESLALSPLPVSPLLLEAPISPLPPSPLHRSEPLKLSPTQEVPISPLRETPLPPVVSPLQVTPHGEDGSSQSTSSKDATSPNAENPHPSPCVFRSVAPKGAVQVKPKANRGRGAARALSMGGKDVPSQNGLTSSSKKRKVLFIPTEKTAWRSGKNMEGEKVSNARGNARPTTLPGKLNSLQLKTKLDKSSSVQNGQEKVREDTNVPTTSQNGPDIVGETTCTLEKPLGETEDRETKNGRKRKGPRILLPKKVKETEQSNMSKLWNLELFEGIKKKETSKTLQVKDDTQEEVASNVEDAAASNDVHNNGGTNKRSLEEDLEDGEVSDESDDQEKRTKDNTEAQSGRAVKKLKTGSREELTADQVLQYMSNLQGGATVNGIINIIMEYLVYSEEVRVNLFPAVKTMCETGTKLPVMTNSEMAILGRVTYLAKLGPWTGLVEALSHTLLEEMCWKRRHIVKQHLLAGCRLYTGLCRLTGNLEKVRILIYDILREKLSSPVDRILTIASVWPLALQRNGAELQDGPMIHVIEHIIMSRDIQEELKSCFKNLYKWKDAEDDGADSLARRLVELLQIKETGLVNDKGKIHLNPLMYETVKALELLAAHQSWEWTSDYLVQTLLLPVLQKWSENKTTNNKLKSSVPRGSAVAVLHVIGSVGRIGLEDNQSSVSQLQQVMVEMLTEAQKGKNSVPWSIQLAAASSLVQLSASNPRHALTALQSWIKYTSSIKCTPPRLLKHNVEILASKCR